MPENLGRAAHQALTAGLCVVPPRENGSKAPVGEWKRYQTSLPTSEQLDVWYRGDRSGIGLVCGKVSGNLELLEFETEHIYLAYLEAALEAGLGDITSRIEAGYLEESPAGGIHWLYRCDQIAGNTKLASQPGSEPGTIKTLIETRGEGGYVICAPSNGQVHPTGRPYKLLAGGFTSIATITPSERAELHRLARSFDRTPEQPRPTHQQDIPPDHLSPGDDYNHRAAWPDLLEPTGWTRVMQAGQLEHWRRPGKQHGISATIQPRESDEPTLKVFSTSTPFATDGTHSKFDAYTLLRHAGDHHAAAKDLYAQGYGDHLDHHGRPCARTDCPNPPQGTPKPPPDEPETDAAGRIQPRSFDQQIVDLAELARNGIQPPELICDKLLYRGALHSLAGPPDSGKSTLLYYWAATLLAAGHTVVLLDEESGREATTEKLLALDATPEHLERLIYIEYPGRRWDAADVAALTELLAKRKPALVGFDSSAAFLAQAGKDENAAVEVTDFYKRVLLEATRIHGTAVVILDHLGKDQVGGRYARGSGAKLATVDVAFMIDPIKLFNRTTPGLLKVTITKDRRGYLHRHHEVRVEVEDGQIALAFSPVEVDDDGDLVGLPPAAVKILEVLKAASGQLTIRQIVDDISSKYGHGLRRNTASSMLQLLSDRRLVDCEASQNGPQKLWWATNA